MAFCRHPDSSQCSRQSGRGSTSIKTSDIREYSVARSVGCGLRIFSMMSSRNRSGTDIHTQLTHAWNGKGMHMWILEHVVYHTSGSVTGLITCTTCRSHQMHAHPTTHTQPPSPLSPPSPHHCRHHAHTNMSLYRLRHGWVEVVGDNISQLDLFKEGLGGASSFYVIGVEYTLQFIRMRGRESVTLSCNALLQP